MPQFIDLSQGSESWLRWREKGLGSSDTAAVLHESPYETAHGLWQLKTGRVQPKPPSRAMQHGTVTEPHVRELYIGEKNIQVEPLSAVYDDAERRARIPLWSGEIERSAESCFAQFHQVAFQSHDDGLRLRISQSAVVL